MLFFSYQRFAFLTPSVKIRLFSLGANIRAMPFKSEKQRRFLWSQHPDIAKRWADEYPGQKNLPQYAHKKKPTDKEKAAAMTELNRQYSVNTVGLRIYSECVKKANSGLLHVEIPHSDKPVAAGDEKVTAKNQGEDKASPVQTRDGNEVNQSREELAGDLVNNGSHPLLKKLAVVLSQPIMQAIENEKAEQQARIASKMPQNAGIKRYAMPASTTPLPMGMQQPAQPAPTPAQQPAQPQQQGTGMNSPSANPINSFGALSSSGNINGNAAFGTKNSPDSSKSASQLYKAARPLGLDNYSSFAGPDQIQHAVQQYGQLKALVRPDDNTLRARGLNRDGFQSSLRHIVRNSQGQDKYNLSDMAPNPNLYAGAAAGLGLLGTAGLGYLGGMDGAGVGLAGTGAGVAAAYMHAANKRKNILNTAKLMKEYGLLKPKTLAHAYPLLSDDHKFASAEEFVSKAAELAVARKS